MDGTMNVKLEFKIKSMIILVWWETADMGKQKMVEAVHQQDEDNKMDQRSQFEKTSRLKLKCSEACCKNQSSLWTKYIPK